MSDATRAPTALRQASRVTEARDWVGSVTLRPEFKRLLATDLLTANGCKLVRVP